MTRREFEELATTGAQRALDRTLTRTLDARETTQKAERLRSLEAQVERAEARRRQLEAELSAAKAKAKDRVIGRAVREGRLLGSQVDEWSRKYDEDPEFVRRVFDDLHPRAHELVGRLYTKADFGEPVDPVKEERRALAARLGIAVEEVL